MIIGIYLGLALLLHIPAVKGWCAQEASEVLSEKLGTRVKVETVDLGMLNRIILTGVQIDDQKKKPMIKANCLAVRISLWKLLSSKVSISAAQIFSADINLYKRQGEKANYQFIIDSLKSKDTTKVSHMNVEISSLIIRRTNVAYNDIKVRDVSSHIILNCLTDDSLNLNVRRLALKGFQGGTGDFRSFQGFQVEGLRFQVEASRSGATLSDLSISLPHSTLRIPEVKATYQLKDGKVKNLKYEGSIKNTSITPSDLKMLVPQLAGHTKPVSISLSCKGTDKRVEVEDCRIKTEEGNLTVNMPKAFYNFVGAKDWVLDVKDYGVEVKGYRLGGALKAKGNRWDADVKAVVKSDEGNLDIEARKRQNQATANLKIRNVELGKLLKVDHLGSITGTAKATATLDGNYKPENIALETNIASVVYKGHEYKDVVAEGRVKVIGYGLKVMGYGLKVEGFRCEVEGSRLKVEGERSKTGNITAQVEAEINSLNPDALGLTDTKKDYTYSGNLKAQLKGKNLKNLCGTISLRDLSVSGKDGEYKVGRCDASRTIDSKGYQKILLNSDFATLKAEGKFEPVQLKESVVNALCEQVPSLRGFELFKRKENSKGLNSCKIYAQVKDTKWAEYFLGVPLELSEPANIIADVNDKEKKLSIRMDALDFEYDSKRYRGSYLNILSSEQGMEAHGRTQIANTALYEISASAKENRISTSLALELKGKHHIQGTLNADGQFFADNLGRPTADITIEPSDAEVGDTLWHIKKSSILYRDKYLEIGNLSIANKNQFIDISGKATEDKDDAITATLKNVDVAYILDLVDFHSVDFDGMASGRAQVRTLFSDPEITANLTVEKFRFEGGRFGTLYASANYNIEQGDIDIDAKASEVPDGSTAVPGGYSTIIKGYVSPKRNSIDLKIEPQGTNLEFLRKYTHSFADNIGLRTWGHVEVVGPLDCIQLVGEADVSGKFLITSLGTTYCLDKQHVHLEPDLIEVKEATITDTLGNKATASLKLPHKHLGHWHYNVDVDAKKLLCFNFANGFGSNNFWGKVYATGVCNISDKTGDAVINVDATPDRGTEFVYDASSPDAVNRQEFIHWNSHEGFKEVSEGFKEVSEGFKEVQGGNLRMNFMIHATQNTILRVLMSRTSNDYITLYGNGDVRATYYNKGSFDMYGNYTVQGGIYNMTVQNIIERRFEFLPGGTIAFGGDAFNAPLNLQARYTIPSVSLSDLNIGKSFANNNVRVDCLMNITGTPGQPQVEFSLNMPTISSDAKQMIVSLMNSEEEVNQQIIYLLTIGRFIAQRQNNDAGSEGTAERQSQTTQAMQSILSGTISQQLSRVLNTVVKNNNWNLGANIATGNDGWSNAEYEGLVSGKLFNNRLLFNGAFGYRDNLNKAQSSFIGDFDIQYLLRPDGGIAIKAYNQTNDRYFTKNSLTTQGIGIILKKDFNSWLDFFRRKKVKK